MHRFTFLLFCTLIAAHANAQLPALTTPVFHVDTSNHNYNFTWTGPVKKKVRDGEWLGVSARFGDTIHAHYTHGKLNGEWTVRYTGGKLAESGGYINNLREGRWIKFNNAGDTIFCCVYKAGVLHGPYRTFIAHNKITRTGTFVDGKKYGTWITSEYVNEEKPYAQTFYPFVNDTLNGTAERRDCDGVKLMYFLGGTILGEEYKSKPDSTYACIEPGIDPAEETPSFPGGDAAMRKYFSDSLRYPKRCIDEGREGKVFVQFTVEADGSITGVTVRKGVQGAPDMDAEAVRLISAMPRWTPGKMNGKAVRVNMTVPVKFDLGH